MTFDVTSTPSSSIHRPQGPVSTSSNEADQIAVVPRRQAIQVQQAPAPDSEAATAHNLLRRRSPSPERSGVRQKFNDFTSRVNNNISNPVLGLLSAGGAHALRDIPNTAFGTDVREFLGLGLEKLAEVLPDEAKRGILIAYWSLRLPAQAALLIKNIKDKKAKPEVVFADLAYLIATPIVLAVVDQKLNALPSTFAATLKQLAYPTTRDVANKFSSVEDNVVETGRTHHGVVGIGVAIYTALEFATFLAQSTPEDHSTTSVSLSMGESIGKIIGAAQNFSLTNGPPEAAINFYTRLGYAFVDGVKVKDAATGQERIEKGWKGVLNYRAHNHLDEDFPKGLYEQLQLASTRWFSVDTSALINPITNLASDKGPFMRTAADYGATLAIAAKNGIDFAALFNYRMNLRKEPTADEERPAPSGDPSSTYANSPAAERGEAAGRTDVARAHVELEEIRRDLDDAGVATHDFAPPAQTPEAIVGGGVTERDFALRPRASTSASGGGAEVVVPNQPGSELEQISESLNAAGVKARDFASLPQESEAPVGGGVSERDFAQRP